MDRLIVNFVDLEPEPTGTSIVRFPAGFLYLDDHDRKALLDPTLDRFIVKPQRARAHDAAYYYVVAVLTKIEPTQAPAPFDTPQTPSD